MAWVPYDDFLGAMGAKDSGPATVDLDGDTFKIALLANAHTPDQTNHTYFSDVDGDEVSGTNYTAGGNACATPIWTVDTNEWTFDAADPATWSEHASGFADAQYAVLYVSTGTNTNSTLLAYNDFGTDKGNTTGDFTVALDSNGIFTLGSA